MVFAKDLTSANKELEHHCNALLQKFSDFKNKKWVNLDVELSGLLKTLDLGASSHSLHDDYKLHIFNFLKHLLAFNESWSQQNGVSFKDKMVMALLLRIMCFNPDGEIVTIPELKGKQMYQFLCNILQRHLGLQSKTLTSMVYQGITSCSVTSGIPKRMVLYLPSATRCSQHWKVEQAAEVSKVISQWFLLHCNQSAPTPTGKKSGLFQKKSPAGVPRTTELDGTSARGIFTVLNIMPSYHGDWLMNMYAFSVLKQWIVFLQGSDSIVECLTNIPVMWGSADRRYSASLSFNNLSPSESSRLNDSGSGSDSVDTQSIASSFMSASESVFADDLYDSVESPRTPTSRPDDTRSQVSFRRSTRSPDTMSITSEVSAASSNLKLVAIKYCLRLLSQSEKIPQRISDRSVVSAAIVQCLHILGHLCDNTTTISQKAFAEVKRLHTRIEGRCVTTRRVYVELLHFFVRHHEAMIIQMDDVLECYFNDIPSKLHHDQIVAFELINLCLSNGEFFRCHTSVLSTYFPNVFKLLAWWPCSFLEESCELIHLCVNNANFMEVFHAILDLPALSALLQLKRSNILEDDALLAQTLGSPIQPYHRAMFSFLMREKSGGGETIDRLSEVHTALEPLASHPRVRYTSDIVPAMLMSLFSTLTDGSTERASVVRNIFPVLLERCFLFYPKTENITNELVEIFADNVRVLSTMLPEVVCEHAEEVLTFLSQVHTMRCSLMPLYCSVVWCIGEHVPAPTSTRQQVATFYETLETMLYEASSGIETSKNILGQPEVLTCLISAIAKLSAYSQELIPRAVVGLTKICNVRKETLSWLQLADRLAVTTHAQEMVNVLQKPKVAPRVLCQRTGQRPWHLGADASLAMSVRVLSKHAEVVG